MCPGRVLLDQGFFIPLKYDNLRHMDTETILLISLVAVGFIALFVFINQKMKKPQQDEKSVLMLQQQINELNKTLDNKLAESTRLMQNQFGQSAKIIADVTEKLVKLDETNKQVMNFTDQLQDLQDMLKNPKRRGVLGEYYLENVLKNVLPPKSYKMQYKFKDGEIVDAVIFVREKIIPIDSKFSLENYNKMAQEKNETERAKLEKEFKNDLKKRIDETAKYIKPEEGTFSYAFMFIPHEAIYYDLLVSQVGAIKISTKDLIEYAYREKHVIIVSPTTFYAYLQMFLQGLKSLEIEKSTQEIIKRVEQLGRHVKNYDSFLQKLGGHLGTTVNTYNTAYKEFKKIDKDVVKISGQGGGVEPTLIDKPKNEEE